MVALQAALEGLKSLTTPFVQPLFVPLLYLMLQSLSTILSVWLNGDRIQDEKDFPGPSQPGLYDFIIVGAGSAGSLLANRLSRTYTVLLLEAGGEPNPLQFIPGFALFLINYPQIDWQHRTVPQRLSSLLSVNGESPWSAGLGLGGSGNLNLMVHLRGHKRDFDNWAAITGDPTWSWEGVLPYFKSYEEYEIPGDNINHGYRGDLRVQAPDYIGTSREFVRAAMELGYPNVDLNAPFNEGFDVIRYSTRRGTRQAPYKAFLEPIRHRRSLTIMKYARVNRVLFREGNLAYGVEYDRHGRTFTAHARREVIISAGAVNTPKLLMLSGVGPMPQLQSLNIPVVSDLPVGENLQDHLGVYLGPFFIREGLGGYFDRDLTPSQFVKWFTLGKGRLSSTGAEATGLIASDIAKARGEGNWPDIQYFSYSYTNFRLGPELLANAFNMKLDELKKYFENTVGRDALFIVVSGARPFARGSIRLASNSAYDKPMIDPNYLGDAGDTDFQVLLDGVKKAMFLMENTTSGGLQLNARFTTNILPGCEQFPFRSDLYWECYIRRFSCTLHHPTATASLGSVVDSELRVMGTENLRVVDASVQPVVVITNTQASTLMIAEKAAHMILRTWAPAYTVKPMTNKKQGILGPIIGFIENKKDQFFSKKNQFVSKKNQFFNNKNAGTQNKYLDENAYWLNKKRGMALIDSNTPDYFLNRTTTAPPNMTPLPPPQEVTEEPEGPDDDDEFEQDPIVEVSPTPSPPTTPPSWSQRPPGPKLTRRPPKVTVLTSPLPPSMTSPWSSRPPGDKLTRRPTTPKIPTQPFPTPPAGFPTRPPMMFIPKIPIQPSPPPPVGFPTGPPKITIEPIFPPIPQKSNPVMNLLKGTMLQVKPISRTKPVIAKVDGHNQSEKEADFEYYEDDAEEYESEDPKTVTKDQQQREEQPLPNPLTTFHFSSGSSRGIDGNGLGHGVPESYVSFNK